MRVLIADDEPIALQRLEMALAKANDVTLAGRAKTGAEAIRLIRELTPDVALLDINMPAGDGFSVLHALSSDAHLPEFVFVTAHQDHALRAFDVGTIDFLLKPVAFDRLQQALARVKERLDLRRDGARVGELKVLLETLQAQVRARNGAQHIWVPTRKGMIQLATHMIDKIEAARDYVHLHAGAESYLLKETISSLEKTLSRDHFSRVRRSTIVNVERVRGARRDAAGELQLVLKNGDTVSVGPTYVESVLAHFQIKRWRTTRL